MTYQAKETSVEEGRPVEIFVITAGSTTYRYTSAQDAQTVASLTYTPVKGLKRSKKEDGAQEREGEFRIELPTEDPVGRLFTGDLPGYRVRVAMRRFHRNDLPTPEVLQEFDGYIESASFKENCKVCVLAARPVLASLGRTIPRRFFTASCNHVLYDPATCKVDDTDPTFRAASLDVSTQVLNALTVSSGLSGVYSDGFMVNGYVEGIGTNDFRKIVGHVGDVLTLQSRMSPTPSSINVFAGCDHTAEGSNGCDSKFNNIENYGGFHFVPVSNPFADGV